MTRARALTGAGVLALFVALTAAITWAQASQLSTMAPPHQDVFFNMWRLRWFAHAMTTSPSHLFDANIFSPEPRALAFSDAMLVEGAVAAPLLLAGMPPVLVHNLMILGAIVLSGVAMFALARHLTGSRGAGIVAGIVFAYAPYRVEHIMHMELQWAMWAPLAFLALHRLYDAGRLRDGLALGACMTLQMLSSIYYGIYLGTLLAVAAVLAFPADRRASARSVVKAVAAGAAIALVICGLYARPYLRVRDRVGERPAEEVTTYSASPADYLAATPDNQLYGHPQSRGRAERHLFPGITAVVLALAGLLLYVPDRRRILYLVLLVAAFEASLGVRGYIFPFLHEHVSVYRGLRASARLGLFVLMFLGVLAAYGYQSLVAGRSAMARRVVLALLVVALTIEYRVAVPLVRYPSTAPDIYRLLSSQPKGIVAEFPVPRADRLPGEDAKYAYFSTFHWFPLVNGYSGTYPPTYLTRLHWLETFPGHDAIRQLQRDGVAYVIVHESGFEPDALNEIHARLTASGLFVELGQFADDSSEARLYRLR